MRLRNIPGADKAVSDSPYCVNDPMNYRGRWQDIFPAPGPLYVEIGMGKGRFIMDSAAAHPDINFIGIERYSSVLFRALQKMEERPLDNLKLICMDAAEIETVFSVHEVSRIFLNFSDPWPKDRHAGRRLTSRRFLALYDKILAPDGCIEFKTDNQDLFSFSLEELKDTGWSIDVCTRNLHQDRFLNEGNIMTEYEEKFSSVGNPICKLTASRSPSFSESL